MTGTYASGRNALLECARCGFTCRYIEKSEQIVRGQKTGLQVCPECLDKDHPQLWIGRVRASDPQALRNPNPQSNLDEQRAVTQVDWTYFPK